MFLDINIDTCDLIRDTEILIIIDGTVSFLLCSLFCFILLDRCLVHLICIQKFQFSVPH